MTWHLNWNFIYSESKWNQALSGFSSDNILIHLFICGMTEKSSEHSRAGHKLKTAQSPRLLLWVLLVIDKQPLMFCWFNDTAVAHLWLCATGAYFQVFPYSLLLCLCYCMVLWLTSAQTCLKLPGDLCSSSKKEKNVYCIDMQGCPLVEWISTKVTLNFISTVWVLT